MSFSKNPFSFNLSSSKEGELDTFEARVQWAIKTRKIYVFKDNDEVGARVNSIDEDYDEEDIRDAQKIFEKRYKLKLQEKEKEAEKTMASDLEQLFRKHPHLRDQIQLPKEKDVPAKEFGKPTSTPRPMMVSFSKRRAGAISDRSEDEEETIMPPSKRFKKDEVPISSKGGALYSISCSNCVKGGYECREQIPPKKACYQCSRMRAGCSFLGNGPKHRRGPNRVGVVKKTGIEVESEEIESETEIVGSRPSRSEVAYAIREQTARMTTELTNIGSILKKIEEQHRSRNEQSDIALGDLKNLLKMISGMLNPVETKKTAVMTSSSASGPNTKGGSTRPTNVADRQHKAF